MALRRHMFEHLACETRVYLYDVGVPNMIDAVIALDERWAYLKVDRRSFDTTRRTSDYRRTN
jgi:hypothetical protein